MGCTPSTPAKNTLAGNKQHKSSQKQQCCVGKSENSRNVPKVEPMTRTDKIVKKSNVDRASRKSVSDIDLHQGLEVLQFSKRESPGNAPPPRALENSKKIQNIKPKQELSQVMAWGKKMTTTENRFLEDLRLHRETCDDGQYEKEYETTGVDETSRVIEGAGSEVSSSTSDILNDLSHHTRRHRKLEQEESFDASKIIDVEKFRAANVTEKQMISHSDQDMNRNYFNFQTTSSKEIHKLNSSIQDLTIDKDEESFNSLQYNEDDENLIESIEREFLLTQDNFLPGQIIN